uniref:Uncharacterized protein n=1 Tax=Rhizophora mucronata TaxID=61149 RepID=A0A2P2NPW0_RHIMU
MYKTGGFILHSSEHLLTPLAALLHLNHMLVLHILFCLGGCYGF